MGGREGGETDEIKKNNNQNKQQRREGKQTQQERGQRGDTAISVKSEYCVNRILPWSVDSASHETVNSRNFRMARRWDHSAYYPPVISPCLRKYVERINNGDKREKVGKRDERVFREDLFCGFHE